MTDDQIRQIITDLSTTLHQVRRGQLDGARAGAEPCFHTITTLWMRKDGYPSVAECRRAIGHDGLHEDEYLRMWNDIADVTMRTPDDQ